MLGILASGDVISTKKFNYKYLIDLIKQSLNFNWIIEIMIIVIIIGRKISD